MSYDGSVVAARNYYSQTDHATRWTAATGLVRIDPGDQVPPSEGLAITRDGNTIVGYNFAFVGSGTLAEWTLAGGWTSLDPGGVYQYIFPRAVTDDGAIIAGVYSGTGFIWDAQHGVRTLQAVLADKGIASTGWQFDTINDMSAEGSVIVGNGSFNGVQQGFVISLVPEPAVGLALLALPLLRRRCRTRR